MHPKETFYSAVVVFGSLAYEMERFLCYARHLIDEGLVQTKHLYLLCGERLAQKAIDGQIVHELALSRDLSIEEVTETHLMQHLYQNIRGSKQFAQLPYTLIDTPKGLLSRPTTVETLKHLAKLSPDLSGDVLFISRSPDIRAHYESTFSTLSQLLPKIKVEVVGEGTENLPLQEIIGALGGTLYGGYPRVAREFDIDQTWENLEKNRKQLRYQN